MMVASPASGQIQRFVQLAEGLIVRRRQELSRSGSLLVRILVAHGRTLDLVAGAGIGGLDLPSAEQDKVVVFAYLVCGCVCLLLLLL